MNSLAASGTLAGIAFFMGLAGVIILSESVNAKERRVARTLLILAAIHTAPLLVWLWSKAVLG